ncbi:MAG: hypothetical protein FK733_03975, partial [Asgard group archaeon]|nr:hypothetical protein [Asgard group archaeon]
MNGKFARTKNWVKLGLVCITILCITFTPVMINQNNEAIFWNGCYTIKNSNIGGSFVQYTEILKNYPSSSYGLQWIGVILIISGVLFSSSNQSDFLLYRNRQRRRLYLFSGILESLGSILGLVSIFSILILTNQFQTFDSQMHFTTGFFFSLLAFTLNVIIALYSLFRIKQRKKLSINEEIKLFDSTIKTTGQHYKL